VRTISSTAAEDEPKAGAADATDENDEGEEGDD
jgi:hypothetical protein